MMDDKFKYQKKYEDKAGIVAKSFKLKKTVVDEFQETCKRLDVPMSKQLTSLMLDFVAEIKEKTE